MRTKQLIEFPLESGGTTLVEVDVPEEPGTVPASRGGEVVRRAQHSFEAAPEKIRPAAQAIIAKLRALHDPPDEIEVEFGIKLSAEAGAFVAAAGAERPPLPHAAAGGIRRAWTLRWGRAWAGPP